MQGGRAMARSYDVPAFYHSECGTKRLFHGNATHAAEINGTHAQAAGAALNRPFKDVDVCSQWSCGSLVGGTKYGNQWNTQSRCQVHRAGIVRHDQPTA